MNQATFLQNNLKSFFRPGGRAWEIRVWKRWRRIFVKPEQGCGAVYLPYLRRFLCTVSDYNPVEIPAFDHGFGELP